MLLPIEGKKLKGRARQEDRIKAAAQVSLANNLLYVRFSYGPNSGRTASFSASASGQKATFSAALDGVGADQPAPRLHHLAAAARRSRRVAAVKRAGVRFQPDLRRPVFGLGLAHPIPAQPCDEWPSGSTSGSASWRRRCSGASWPRRVSSGSR